MSKVISVVPYFENPIHYNGNISIDKKNLEAYFMYTIESLQQISDTILVGFTNKLTMENIWHKHIAKLQPLIFSNIEDVFLPSSILGFMKQESFPYEYDYVFYNEPDQIVNVKDFDKITSTIGEEKNIYISPHRLEPLPSANIQKRKKYSEGYYEKQIEWWRATKVARQNHVYIHTNISPQPIEWDDYYIKNEDEYSAFSGSWVCHKELLDKVKLTFAKDFSTSYAGGQDIFHTEDSISLKTKDPENFFVDRVSAWELNAYFL